ncbi:type I-C CRISPR-associated protein Cas8c/Csd1 [Saccharopolyspora rosea]|uniref:Type I-C CRISPR-associated protein Cas8c/Csd1 n=1 Tax=Saccharopolyspora rosea TaxID=524884 RepID=A0ABW3FXM2_9PSEU
MLVQRLVEYAREQCTSKPFHREREFTWRLNLSTKDGKAALYDCRAPDGRGKPRGQRHLVPSVTRTVGVAAQLGADDVQYVLGWGDDTTKPTRVEECHRAFVELIDRWAEAASQRCPEAEVVRGFYARCGVEELHRPDGVTAKQGVLITVDDTPITELEALTQFWVEEVARRKTGGTTGLCLVCGQESVLADTVPGNISKALVPGAANNPALISVNAKPFGYQLTTGLEHTPICLACGDAMNTALTALLSGQYATGMPGQDSVLTWWTLGQPPSGFFAVMPDQAHPKDVNRLLKRLYTGDLAAVARASSPGLATDRFCSVTLGGSSSRIMVRDWIDMPLPEVEENLAHWYHDHLINTRWDDEPVAFPLRELERATGRWDREQRRYADPKTDTAVDRPEHVHRDLLRAALRRVPLPPAVWQHVLRRISTDGRIDGPRAALLRLGLRRHPRKEITMPAGLDETSEDPAYVAGRAFALYERIQYHASAADRAKQRSRDDNASTDTPEEERPKGLNATFTDRYFSGAVTNPHTALMAGSRLLSPWLSKIRRAGKPGLARLLKSELDQVLKRAPSLPRRLTPEQQAQFVLGYHHQCAHDADQRRARQQNA